MVLPGYCSRIVHIDLTTEKIGYEKLYADTARRYIGGVGLAAKILWEDTTADTDPLSPDNPLTFVTPAPCGAKMQNYGCLINCLVVCCIPPRLLTHKRGKGGTADSLPFLGLMLNEYYSYSRWSEEGIPTKEKLAELGLEQCLGPGRHRTGGRKW